jgi:hypothetical protein
LSQQVGFHPEAREELRHAVEFYEAQAQGLGRELLEEVESAVAAIAAMPEAAGS